MVGHSLAGGSPCHGSGWHWWLFFDRAKSQEPNARPSLVVESGTFFACDDSRNCKNSLSGAGFWRERIVYRAWLWQHATRALLLHHGLCDVCRHDLVSHQT